MFDQKSTQERFCYGDGIIEFTRTIRKTDNGKVLIKVHPDCRVIAHAPESASTDQVISAVRKRSRWIWRKLQIFRQLQQHITPKHYISGESHYYLGRRYMLKIYVDSKADYKVKLMRGRLEVYVKKHSPKKVKELLSEWYKNRAREIFDHRLEVLAERASWIKSLPQTRLQVMKMQWGSCSPNGRITLNPLLIKAPKECIDYVILHELCHIAEHNHSKQFYRRMNRIMPKWEAIKADLDRRAETILI